MTKIEPTAFKVLIIDDHAVVRRGIAAYLEVLEHVEVVGQAENGRVALELLAERAAYDQLPDVALLDLMMPVMDGMQTLGHIRARYPSVNVVILTSFGEPERLHEALRQGAKGYLLKDAGPEEVAGAISAAARGEVYLDPALALDLTRSFASPPTGISTLTDRERDVLILVAGGHSNQDIARELGISERTARTHVSNMLGKLGLSSRTQAALAAVNAGLVSP